MQAPLQRLVFLNELAVLINGGGTNALQFAVSQRRFQHVAGVNGTLGGSGANHGVNLINEKNDLALGLADFVHDRLESLLKFAAELAACHQGTHVKRDDTSPFERIGDIIGGDFLGQPLGDGGFAHAGLTDDHRIVLGTPDEYLHDPLDFVLAADNRVELTLSGKLGKVASVFLQRTIMALRPGIVNSMPAAEFLQGAVDLFLVNTELFQNGGGFATFGDDSDEQVLGADVLVFQSICLFVSQLEKLGDARCGIYLPGIISNLGHFAQCCFHRLFYLCGVDIQFI